MAKLINKKSLSLIEIMISAVIILIVLGGLLFTFVQCMFLNEQNSNLATALNDAQFVLEEMRSLAFSGISTYVAPSPPPSSAILRDELINVATNIGLNLAEVVVTVSWTGRRGSPSVELSTAIAKTAK